jgi:3-hydroxy-9,10-secoandrosta-1,3,5(10)-triene-9,17-dione monooxygenase
VQMAVTSIKVPEPNLTPDAVIARAREMVPMLRAQQAECERAGRVLDSTNEQFVKAGFYRLVQPRRFGGYEFDIPTYHRVMIEIARGCPSSGWVLALTAGHPIILARFGERAQLEAYGRDGEFRAPATAAPAIVTADGDGYRVKGFWDYASGCDIGTHFIAPGLIPASNGKPLRGVLMLLQSGHYRIIDNWEVFAMKGTGSKRIAIEEEITVPAYRVVEGGLGDDPPVGKVLEGLENPLYHGLLGPFLVGEGTAVAVGIARGAIDIYEEMLADKATNFPPFVKRGHTQEYQQHLGRAYALVDAAEAALLKFGEDYIGLCARRMQDAAAFSDETQRRLVLRLQECINQCWEAVDLLFTTGGTANGRSDSMLGRYFRDLAMMRTHIVFQHARTAANFGALRMGQPPRSPF